jgi:uncharacterized protein (DUF2147 family)
MSMSIDGHREVVMCSTNALRWLACVGISAALPAAASPLDPQGSWSRGDGNASVRIAPCGANLCATNIWIRDTSKGEAVGDVLIMKVKPADGGSLAGTARDPKRKLTYSIRISGTANTLKTRGCFLGGLACKTVSWTRLR